MWSLAQHFVPVLLHATKERTRNLHVHLRWQVRPRTLLVAVLLWYHPSTESDNFVVVLGIYHHERLIGGIVDAHGPAFIPELAACWIILHGLLVVVLTFR